MKIAYLTAGAGGMFCGSCMRDNTLVAAMGQLGVDAVLVPTYTPIRTDVNNVSVDEVFYGGINVFLQQKIPLLKWLPGWADRFLDRPSLIRWATKGGMETSAKQLGALTVSMLRGAQGRQRKEVTRLCKWLERELAPDVVMLSNLLIGGCIPQIKQQLGAKVFVTLQGDDIFLNELVEPYRQQALEQLWELGKAVDGFLVNSRYYGQYMSELLQIPADKVHVTPLGLDIGDFQLPADRVPRPPTVGYLARLAPEKGLHQLIDAFLELKQSQCMDARLRIAGWLGPQHQEYAAGQLRRLDDAGFSNDYECLGEVNRDEKLKFLNSIDVLSVPTVYREPKGLYVLEALASSVPVVQPRHGAFPELLASTGGGLLVTPGNAVELSAGIAALLNDSVRRQELAEEGRESVLQRHTAEAMAEATLRIISE